MVAEQIYMGQIMLSREGDKELLWAEEDRMFNDFNSKLGEQADMFGNPEDNDNNISQGGPQVEDSVANLLKGSVKIGPLYCVSEAKLYASYKKDI